jgi:hypothetical protein
MRHDVSHILAKLFCDAVIDIWHFLVDGLDTDHSKSIHYHCAFQIIAISNYSITKCIC